jgi:D-alanine--poly(phosphoribitol) ligase subunit 2
MNGHTPTEEQLFSIFENQLSRRVPDTSTNLFESQLLDSLALIELLTAIEQHMGVSISFEELDASEMETLSKIAAMVDRHRT